MLLDFLKEILHIYLFLLYIKLIVKSKIFRVTQLKFSGHKNNKQ